jgi:hypothetical protein
MSKNLLSLARLTGKASEELDGLLYDGGELKEDWSDVFSGLVLDNFKEKERKKAEDFRLRGIKEKAQAIEKIAKPLLEKYGIEADRIEDGLEQLAEQLQAEPGTPGAEGLTPEQLRNHPAFKQAVQQDIEKLTKANNELKAKAAKAEADKDAFIQEQQKAAHVNTLSSLARKELKALEASFGADEDKALKAFFALYPPDRFRVEGEAPVPLDENGQPATDEYGDPLPFAEYLRKNWLFGFQSNQPKTPAPPTKGAAGATKTFANEDAYNQAREAAAAAGDWGKVATLEKQYIKELNS